MTNRKSLYIVIIIISIGLIVMFFLMSKQSDFYDRLEKIVNDKSYDIKVKDAYNERGIYVLNNKYYLNSATFVIGNHYGYSKDNSIWKPKNAKYRPRISDISAPFIIQKDIDNDTLKLKKEDKTILLLLKYD